MIERYGLFDSIEGDERVYAEADFARLVKAIGGDGVRGGKNALKITPKASGLGVDVQSGMAIVQGRYYALEDDGSGARSIDLTTAREQPRIDRIVLCLNYGTRTIALGTITGVEAASPVAPALTRSTACYMLSLAQVRVGVGAASLDEGDITDERADEALCGLHAETAQAAMAKAKEAAKAADAAQATADEANHTAAAAASKANAGLSNASAAMTEAHKRILKVTGAAQGHLPVFAADGGLVSGGVGLADFTRATMTLSGTTLTITTVQ